MRTRPQPNRLRGILRATLVAVVLIALLVGAVLVIQTLTAAPAKAPTLAPTPPSTPGPVATPHLFPTKPAAHATPSPTHTKKAAAGHIGPQSSANLNEVSGRRLYDQLTGRARKWPDNATPSLNGQVIAYFEPGGDAYKSWLDLADSASGASIRVGYGDPYVRPVWSRTGQYLLYARVAETKSFPGARWSLLSFNTRTHHNTELTQVNAMSLIPLGWSGRSVLYLVGNATDTSIYALFRGHARFISILMPQPLTSATLSPDGRYIADGAPTNCHGFCTLDVFDLQQPAAWIGPTGLPNEATLTWSVDGDTIVTVVKNKLAAIGAGSHDVRLYSLPRGLPCTWPHPMRAVVSRDFVLLTDTIAHRTYRTGM